MIAIYNRKQLYAKTVSFLKEICIKKGIKLPITKHFKKKFIDRILFYQELMVPNVDIILFFRFLLLLLYSDKIHTILLERLSQYNSTI